MGEVRQWGGGLWLALPVPDAVACTIVARAALGTGTALCLVRGIRRLSPLRLMPFPVPGRSAPGRLSPRLTRALTPLAAPAACGRRTPGAARRRSGAGGYSCVAVRRRPPLSIALLPFPACPADTFRAGGRVPPGEGRRRLNRRVAHSRHRPWLVIRLLLLLLLRLLVSWRSRGGCGHRRRTEAPRSQPLPPSPAEGRLSLRFGVSGRRATCVPAPQRRPARCLLPTVVPCRSNAPLGRRGRPWRLGRGETRCSPLLGAVRRPLGAPQSKRRLASGVGLPLCRCASLRRRVRVRARSRDSTAPLQWLRSLLLLLLLLEHGEEQGQGGGSSSCSSRVRVCRPRLTPRCAGLRLRWRCVALRLLGACRRRGAGCGLRCSDLGR